MDNKKYFVRTRDENVAKELREAGFTEQKQEGNIYVFLNDCTKFDFSFLKGKVQFSNKLCF